MSDNTRRVSRRKALKGIAAVGSTGAVGAGGIIHASEPAAATGHAVEIDDITVETIDGEIEEIGISDLWFEVTYQNIPIGITVSFRFWETNLGPKSVDSVDLGVSGDGSETFGFGDKYTDHYDENIGENVADRGSIDAPLTTTDDEFLSYVSLDPAQDQKTVEDMAFEINLLNENNVGNFTLLNRIRANFDLTVLRVEPDGGVDDGEGDAYGEG